MCTIAILIGVTDYPVVLAANRDELYARPTRAPQPIAPGIVAGVDVQSGGTWLAIDASGRFAAVTNQRALAARPVNVRSRGLAVVELAAAADPDAYVAALDPRAYASMNLVWGDASRVAIAYVRHEGDKEIVVLPRGIHVLTNDRLGSPDFPRAQHFAAAIEPHVREPWPALAARLASALADHSRFAVAAPAHVPLELADALTATCIHTPPYGTRSATIVALAPGRVAHYLHADGTPCTTPFEDLGGLLARA
jgi:uncharacterized protein with NRDE domain